MKLKKGEKLPEARLVMLGKEHKEINTSEILNSGKVILFGLPGAFTPTCSAKHLPGFVLAADQFKEKKIRIIRNSCNKISRTSEGKKYNKNLF